MDAQEIRQELDKYDRARNNLKWLIGFTVVNLVLLVVNANIYLVFSATLPQVVFQFGQAFAEAFWNDSYLVTGLVTACAIIGFYLICWFLAKRFRFFILIALIFFAVDSLLLVYFVFQIGLNDIFSNLIDIGVHGYLLYSLFIGVTAWLKLRKIHPDDLQAALSGKDIAAETSGQRNSNDWTDDDM